MNSVVENSKDQFEKTLNFLQSELSSLRTGRIAPSIVEKVNVESYGVRSELLQLASITSPEPQTIVIKPWDKNILKDIERALISSDLNINPVVDGDLVRLNFPPLTEESRKELVKILNKKIEESRIALRTQRDKVKEDVISLEKSKEISEDERFSALKDLDTMTKDYNSKIKEICDNKQEEIMTI